MVTNDSWHTEYSKFYRSKMSMHIYIYIYICMLMDAISVEKKVVISMRLHTSD